MGNEHSHSLDLHTHPLDGSDGTSHDLSGNTYGQDGSHDLLGGGSHDLLGGGGISHDLLGGGSHDPLGSSAHHSLLLNSPADLGGGRLLGQTTGGNLLGGGGQDPPIQGGLFSYEHHPDCDTAYPTDDPWKLPENFVCNEAETHDFWPDVRECLQDEQDAGVGFFGRHEDCFEQHFFP